MSSSSVTSFTSAESFPVERESALPRFCSCGRAVVVRMSRTTTNPLRLFFTCPISRGEDNSHLFKWVDESMIDEVHLLRNMLSELRAHMGRVEASRKHEREVASRMLKAADNMMTEVGEMKSRTNKHVKLSYFLLGFVAGVVFHTTLGFKC